MALFELVYAWLISFVFAASVQCAIMQSSGIADQLGNPELAAIFDENFDSNTAPSLHQIMYKGDMVEQWTVTAQHVGAFLTKLRLQGKSKEAAAAQFNSPSPLYDWLKSLGSSNESYQAVIPNRLGRGYSPDRLQQRGAEAMKTIEQQQCICLQNVVSKNIKVSPSQIWLNPKTIKPKYGPSALDSALFMADILLMYYKQMGVISHKQQWQTVETAQRFGRIIHEESTGLGVTEQDQKSFWSDVSLLTGWEIVRRFTNKDNVDEILARSEHDPAAVTESGLRLINATRITGPGSLVNIALALLY